MFTLIRIRDFVFQNKRSIIWCCLTSHVQQDVTATHSGCIPATSLFRCTDSQVELLKVRKCVGQIKVQNCGHKWGLIVSHKSCEDSECVSWLLSLACVSWLLSLITGLVLSLSTVMVVVCHCCFSTKCWFLVVMPGWQMYVDAALLIILFDDAKWKVS